MIGKNGPYIFLGQIEIKDLLHDDGAVYVFYDPKSGDVKTIIQTY